VNVKQYITEKEKEALELETRRKIYKIVGKHAGCYFREIERKSGLSTGSVQYHLHYLVKKGLLKQQKDGKNMRYFPNNVELRNKKVLSLLRQKSVRDIILYILKNKKCNHKELVAHTNLSPSTVSWHLKKLDQEQIVGFVRKGRETQCSLLIDEKEIVQLLVTYQESFYDTLVDNVIDMWEG
jgi:predicted transcriptional regulator